MKMSLSMSVLIVRYVLVGVAFGSLLSIASPSLVFGLPRGYKEDFNGCAKAEDQAERDRCCQETYDDCIKQCEKDSDDPGAQISCTGGCAIAGHDCKKGQQIPLLQWPGMPGLELPWVVANGNQLVPEPGVRFAQGDNAVIIEMRNANDGGKSCIAIVAACHCPRAGKTATGTTAAGGEKASADGSICRVYVESQKAQCRLCPPGAGPEKCTPCPDCTPVVLAVQLCDAPAAVAAAETKPAKGSKGDH